MSACASPKDEAKEIVDIIYKVNNYWQTQNPEHGRSFWDNAFALLHNLKHNKVLHERVILLTLRTEDAPYVHNVRRVQIEQLSPSFWRVVASYGWRETPNVEEVFHRCGLEGLSCRMMETSFFMSHESLIIGKRPWYLRLRGKLYLLLQRNALRAPDQFEIPPNRVIELGTQVEI